VIIPINISPNGEINFDENLVCSINSLREVFKKFGIKPTAAVMFYCDLLSPYHSLHEDIRMDYIKDGINLIKFNDDDSIVKNAIKEYSNFCANTSIGKLMIGLEKKMDEFGEEMQTDKINAENRKQWAADIIDIGKMPEIYMKTRDMYKKTEEDAVKKRIKGDRKLTLGERLSENRI
jgi:hypothetical protein